MFHWPAADDFSRQPGISAFSDVAKRCIDDYYRRYRQQWPILER